MITPSFALTATERVLPKLALDFTTASLDSRVTFTRALATATRVNSSGYVEGVAADTPRFDYDPVTLACKGLLIEESRTNIQTYSEDFGNVIWNKVRASVSTNQISSPSNAVNADKVVEDSSTSTTHFLRQDINLTSGTTYSFSIFAKAGERPALEIKTGADNGVFADQQVKFNLSTGVATNTGAGTPVYSMTPFGNGWYRCAITVTAAATALAVIRYFLNDGNSSTYSGNGTSGLYVWGAQLEAGAFSTSYTPNVATGTTTRNADVATMTGTNFSSWFNATQGSFKIISTKLNTGTTAYPRILTVKNSGAATSFMQAMWAEPVNRISAYVQDAGAGQADVGTNGLTQTSQNTFAFAYKANSFAGGANAASPQTDAAGTVPSLDNLSIMCSAANTDVTNGWIAKLFYWPQRITNNEVQAFSK